MAAFEFLSCVLVRYFELLLYAAVLYVYIYKYVSKYFNNLVLSMTFISVASQPSSLAHSKINCFSKDLMLLQIAMAI